MALGIDFGADELYEALVGDQAQGKAAAGGEAPGASGGRPRRGARDPFEGARIRVPEQAKPVASPRAPSGRATQRMRDAAARGASAASRGDAYYDDGSYKVMRGPHVVTDPSVVAIDAPDGTPIVRVRRTVPTGEVRVTSQSVAVVGGGDAAAPAPSTRSRGQGGRRGLGGSVPAAPGSWAAERANRAAWLAMLLGVAAAASAAFPATGAVLWVAPAALSIVLALVGIVRSDSLGGAGQRCAKWAIALSLASVAIAVAAQVAWVSAGVVEVERDETGMVLTFDPFGTIAADQPLMPS